MAYWRVFQWLTQFVWRRVVPVTFHCFSTKSWWSSMCFHFLPPELLVLFVELIVMMTQTHYDVSNGPLARYAKLLIAHAPEMPGTFSLPPRISDPDMHHGTCVTHVPWCIPGSLTCGFIWSRCRGKRSRHSQRMRNPQFYVFGKRPMDMVL